MGTKTWLAVIAAAAVIIAVGGWLQLRTAPAATVSAPAAEDKAGPRPTRAQRAGLEAQAADACRCARRLPDGSPGRDRCWAGFEQSLRRYPHSEMASTCIPLSTILVCFNGDRDCIVRDHGAGACTAEEARTLDAVWASNAGGDQPNFDRANRRIEETVQAFIRGERVPMPRTSGGCSG